MADLSEALKEAYATVPDDTVIWHCLEFDHPTFLNEAGARIPGYVVLGNAILTAGIEAGALNNPGEFVDFMPVAFDFRLPPTDPQQNVRLELILDNVGSALTKHFEPAVEDGRPITTIYRTYLSTDLSAPAAQPIELSMANIKVTTTEIRGSAMFADLLNRPFPNKRYDPDTAPFLFPT